MPPFSLEQSELPYAAIERGEADAESARRLFPFRVPPVPLKELPNAASFRFLLRLLPQAVRDSVSGLRHGTGPSAGLVYTAGAARRASMRASVRMPCPPNPTPYLMKFFAVL